MHALTRRGHLLTSLLALPVVGQRGYSHSKVAHATMSPSGQYTYKYPRPGMTVDAAIISKPSEKAEQSQILLVKRKNPPCKDQWALPGGFVDENEALDHAAARELEEETSVKPSDVFLEQFGAFGDPGRDPRGWTISVAYVALVPSNKLGVKANDDAADAQWFNLDEVPQPLAFDHKLIVREAFQHLLKGSQAQQGSLKDQLEAGAQNLKGPWEAPKE